MTQVLTPPAGRYGSPRRGRLLVAALGGLVAVSFLGWLAWSTYAWSTPQVTSELISWRVAGPSGATAQVNVHLQKAGVVASCTLRAYAADHTVVGERVFSVPGPDDTGSGTLTMSIRTERTATSLDLIGCTTPDQNRPR